MKYANKNTINMATPATPYSYPRMLVEITNPIPPAPTIPSIVPSEKLISNLIPTHAAICISDNGRIALKKIL